MSEKSKADSESQSCNLDLSKEDIIELLTRDILSSSVVIEEEDSPENSAVAGKSELDAVPSAYQNTEGLLLDACGPTLTGESDAEKIRASQAEFDARLRRKIRRIVPADVAESQDIINSAILGLLNRHESIEEIAERHHKADEESRKSVRHEARGLIFQAVDWKAKKVLRDSQAIMRDRRMASSITAEDGSDAPIADARTTTGEHASLYVEAATELVERLNATERKVLVGMLHGMSDLDISVQIDRDLRTVRRARTKLREILTKN